MKIWWFGAALIGFFTSLTASYIGIGGGVLLTPMLMIFFKARGIDSPYLMQHIFATNMMFVLVSSSITAYRYKKIYPLKIEKIKWLLVGAATGAAGGGFLASLLPGAVLKQIFGVVIILSALRFLIPSRGAVENGTNYVHPLLGFAGGLLAGGIAPLAGIGGGVVFIPILALTYKMPIKQVPGYSHMAIVLTVSIGLMGYIWHGWGIQFPDYSLGFVNVTTALLMILGAPAGIWLGIKLNGYSSPKLAKNIIGLFIFTLAVYVTFLK